MSIIRYAIADDHKIFREGLKFALRDDDELYCIGEAENGKQLLALLEKEDTDLVLLDLEMPEMNGLQATLKIREKYPDIKLLIITMHDEEHFIVSLMENGANGYLQKNAEPEELKIAIHSAFESGYYFNDLVSSAMLKSIVSKSAVTATFKKEINLSEKETEVLRLICEEYTAAEIGEKLFLSPRTVEGIRAGMLKKIGVHNIAGLVLYAIKNGIVS